jgi:MFS family permease
LTEISGTGRNTFLNISSFQALAMFRRGLFYSYMSIYLRFFLGLSVTETTFFATFPMILSVLFQTFVWGVISDKYQKRRTLIILGEITAAISTFLVWLIHTVPGSGHTAGYVIIGGMSFVEIFWSMSNVGWAALISDLYPEYQRAAIQGRLASLGALGRMIGVWIGGLAYDGLARYYEGWGFDKGLLFFIASGVMLLSTIPMLFVPEGGSGRASGSEGSRRHAFLDLGGLSSCSRKFLMFLLAMVLINFGRNCVVLIKTQYLVLDEGFDVSSSLLSHIVNMHSVAILFGGVLVARFSKRVGDQSLLLWGSLVAALHLVGFVFARTLPMIFAANFFSGGSDVVIMAASYAYASRLIPPEHRGKQFALFNATLFLSWGTAATLISGPIVDHLIGSGFTQVFAYRMAFVVATAVVAMGMAVLVYVNRMPNPGCGTPSSQ